MARDRMLRKAFWDSLTIGRLSEGARLLFQCMWNFSDDEGRSKGWDPEYWRGQAFRFNNPPRTVEAVQAMMDEITNMKLVIVYEIDETRYSQVRSWHEHQRIDHPTPSQIPPPEHSTNTPGALREDSRPKKKKIREKKEKLFPADSFEIRMSELLLSLILQNFPEHKFKAKPPNMQTWALDIDRMIRIDKRTHEQIETVLRWSQKDTFWFKNIWSTAKLREKYDQLVAKMKETKTTRQFAQAEQGKFDDDQF